MTFRILSGKSSGVQFVVFFLVSALTFPQRHVKLERGLCQLESFPTVQAYFPKDQLHSAAFGQMSRSSVLAYLGPLEIRSCPS